MTDKMIQVRFQKPIQFTESELIPMQ